MSLHARIALFSIAIIAALLALFVTAHVEWEVSLRLEDHFGDLEDETHRISDQMIVRLREANELLLRYELLRREEDASKLQRSIAGTREWIQQRKQVVETEATLALLEDIEGILLLYSYQAEAREASGPEAGGDEQSERSIRALEATYSKLLSLARELSLAQEQALRRDLVASRRAPQTYRFMIYGVLASLAVALLFLARMVYRDVIAPLQRKVIERQQQLQRQERIASLGLLSAGIAHEIRNPLAAMKARIYTLVRSQSLNSSDYEDVEVIGGEIRRLEGIVQGFLDMSRPPKPSMGPVRPRSVMEETLKLMSPQAETRGVELELGVIADASIQADANQLKQALINLLRNAIESIEGGGKITLWSEVASVDLSSGRSRRCSIHVTDSGKGLSQETEKRMFEPFFSTKSDGTGIGLALTRRLLQEQGAEIGYQTCPGKGSTFSLMYPLREE